MIDFVTFRGKRVYIVGDAEGVEFVKEAADEKLTLQHSRDGETPPAKKALVLNNVNDDDCVMSFDKEDEQISTDKCPETKNGVIDKNAANEKEHNALQDNNENHDSNYVGEKDISSEAITDKDSDSAKESNWQSVTEERALDIDEPADKNSSEKDSIKDSIRPADKDAIASFVDAPVENLSKTDSSNKETKNDSKTEDVNDESSAKDKKEKGEESAPGERQTEHSKQDETKKKKGKTCEECGLKRKLKFQVIFNGKRRLLCSYTCCKKFKSKQSQSKPPEETPDAPPSSDTEKSDKCGQCHKDLTTHQSDYQVPGQLKTLCSEECIKNYHAENLPVNSYLGSRCTCCHSPIPQTSLGVCFGADIRQFCSSSCLDQFKKNLKDKEAQAVPNEKEVQLPHVTEESNPVIGHQQKKQKVDAMKRVSVKRKKDSTSIEKITKKKKLSGNIPEIKLFEDPPEDVLKRNNEASKKKRRTRCRMCEGCLKQNCTTCKACLDMKIYGGPGKRRQACLNKKCKNLEDTRKAADTKKDDRKKRKKSDDTEEEENKRRKRSSNEGSPEDPQDPVPPAQLHDNEQIPARVAFHNEELEIDMRAPLQDDEIFSIENVVYIENDVIEWELRLHNNLAAIARFRRFMRQRNINIPAPPDQNEIFDGLAGIPPMEDRIPFRRPRWRYGRRQSRLHY